MNALLELRAAEASAACRIPLFGGAVAGGPKAWPASGIAVAIDRRPFARVEVGGQGMSLLSKDSLLQLELASVRDLAESGLAGLVRGVLLELGLETGVRVVTEARVPFGAGLGSAAALAVALAAAAARAAGRALPPEELVGFARHGARLEAGFPGEAWAAIFGGVVAAAVDTGRAERLRVDPARLEECLMLVDLGSPGAVAGEPSASVQASGDVEFPERLAALGERARAALLHARLEEVPGLLAAEGAVWREVGPPPSPRLAELERLVSRHSGAARACGPGPANLAFVWAAPGARGRGPREEVVRALAGGAFRVYPCRVDLRGLEVDDA